MSDESTPLSEPAPTQPLSSIPAGPAEAPGATGTAAPAPPPPGQPATVADGPGPARRRGLGTAAVVASVVAVVGIAGGGFAAWRFLAGGGAQPVDVLPDTTFAVVSVDLDPSGGQKIEAIRTLRKFPTFTASTDGLRPDDDVVKKIWNGSAGTRCKDVSYAKDIAPWLGKRAALAGVRTTGGKPWPALVVQITDTGAAKKGLAKLEACNKSSGGEDFGFVVRDDYAIASDSAAHAKVIADNGRKSPLGKDAAYQKWTQEAGGAGIVNAYVSKKVVDLFRDQMGSRLDSAPAATRKQLERALDKFQGLGAVVRFADGGLEVEMAAGGDTSQLGTKSVGDHVNALPKDTAALLAGAVDGKALGKRLTGTLKDFGQAFGGASGDVAQQLEQQTGLKLPDDLATVLGDSFSLSVGGDAPSDLSKVQQPADLPVGYLVRGDEKAVQDVVDRLQQKAGVSLKDVPATFDTAGGKAVLASNPDYAKQLLGKGSLGSSKTFTDVVPQADKSPFVLYVGLDRAWTKALTDLARNQAGSAEKGKEIAGDIEALKAFGFSTWIDGDKAHALMRLKAR